MTQPEATRHKKRPAKQSSWMSRLSIVHISTILYGAFAAVGIGISAYGHHNLRTILSVPAQPTEAGKLLAAGLLGAGILWVLSKSFEWSFRSYRMIKAAMVQVLGRCTVPVAIYLAFASSVGEELLFRGAIQPTLGIGMTALLFGLLHIGPSGNLSTWSIWAVAAGGLLGYMFDQTQSLWPPLITHFAVNAVSILQLRAIYARIPASKRRRRGVIPPPPEPETNGPL